MRRYLYELINLLAHTPVGCMVMMSGREAAERNAVLISRGWAFRPVRS